MAFKTFKTTREPVNLTLLGEKIAAHRLAIGKVEIPRNNGARRTASKRALLAQISELGGDW